MVKTRKHTLKILVLILIALTILSSAVYALFFTDTNFGLSGNGKEIDFSFSGTTLSSKEFNQKGDVIEKSVMVSNVGCPINYDIIFQLTNNSGLENAVLVYIDDELKGTLKSEAFSLEKPLYKDETMTHKIKLVYHIGASDYFSDKSFDLEIKAEAKSYRVDEILFVSNEKELHQVFTNTKYLGRVAVLTKDIVLTKNFTAVNLINLDLNGKSLSTTQNYTFNIASSESGVFNIYSSKTGSGLSGNFVANTPNAVVLSKFEIKIEAFSTTLFAENYDKFLTERLNNPIEKPINVLEEYKNYEITVILSPSSRLSFSTIDGLLTPHRDNITRSEIVGFVVKEYTQNFDVQVLAKDEISELRDLLKSEILHLDATNNSHENRQLVSSDMFLPLKSLNKNATFVWESSAEYIIDTNGRFYPPVADTEFEVTVIATFGNSSYAYTYFLKSKGVSALERIKRFVMENTGFLYSNINESKTLPLVADYPNFGFSDLTYYLPYDKNGKQLEDIFRYDNQNTLTLIGNTDLNEATLQFSVVVDGTLYNFENTSGLTTLGISIDISKSISIFDASYNFALTSLKDRLDYDLSGFELPKNYNNAVEISYEIIPGEFVIDDTRTYKNPTDIFDFVNFAVLDGTGDYELTIDKYKVPTFDSQCFIKMTLEYNGVVQYRVIPFGVAGVYHNSDKDIPDISLYYALQKRFDKNNDTFITVQEVKQGVANEKAVNGKANINLSKKGISNLKGIELLGDVDGFDLSFNDISETSYLRTLHNLSYLNLSNNKLLAIDSLSELAGLLELNLSNNNISSIESLSDLIRLKTFKVNGNATLSSFDIIKNFTRMTTFYAFNTLSVTLLSENQNSFITAYQNAMMGSASIDMQILNTTQYVPTEQLLIVNQAINQLSPIYEFENVVFLPNTATFEGRQYGVTWSTSHTNIINIVTSADGVRAYIVQPVADKSIKIFAEYAFGNWSRVKRAFDVIALQKNYTLNLEYMDGSVKKQLNAMEAIPDPALRYALFSIFDVDSNKTITLNEINTAYTSSLAMPLNGLGIKSLEGIQYFTSITQVNLKDNLITDFSLLKSLPLVALYINGTLDFKDFDIATLRTLDIIGAANIKDVANLTVLRGLMEKYSNLTIFKDYGKGTWDPFFEEVTKVASQIENYYLLNFGQTINLPKTITKSYLGVNTTFNLSYSKPRGSDDFLINTATPSISYPTGYLSVDGHGQLTVVVSGKNKTVSRTVYVICYADTDFYVETKMSDGSTTYVRVDEAFPNQKARQAIIGKYAKKTLPDGRKLIALVDFWENNSNALTSIEFSGANVSLKGLEYFYDSKKLTTVIISGYRPMGDSLGQYSLYNLMKNMFTKLESYTATTLRIVNSVFSFEDIKDTRITNLVAINCLKIDTDCNFSEAMWKNFKSMILTNSNLIDFSFLDNLPQNHNLSVIHIYGNKSSLEKLPSDKLKGAYDRLSASLQGEFDYRLISETTYWKPDAIGEMGIFIVNADKTQSTYANPGAHNVNYMSSGDSITLPAQSRKGFTINWTVGSSSLIIEESTVSGSSVFTVKTNSLNSFYKSYTKLVGRVTEINNEVVYYIMVNGLGAKVANDIDYDLFMADGKVAEPYMLNYLTYGLSQSRGNKWLFYVLPSLVNSVDYGVFKENPLQPYLEFHHLNDGSRPMGISNINGIENFKNITSVKFWDQSVNDLSPIQALTNLKVFEVKNSNSTSLKTKSGESIFKDATNLTQIKLDGNFIFDDYSPIVYAYGTTLREGLSNLKSIDIPYQTGAPNMTLIEKDKMFLESIDIWLSSFGGIYSGLSLKILNWSNAITSQIQFAEVKTVITAFYKMAETVDISPAAEVTEMQLSSTLKGLEGNELLPSDYPLSYTTYQTVDKNSTYLTFNGTKVNISHIVNKIDVVVPIIPYVKMVNVGANFIFWRQNLNIKFVASTDPKAQTIEMKGWEILDRENLSSYHSAVTADKHEDIFNIPASLLIPDGVFRGLVFQGAYFNTEKNTETYISYIERQKVSNNLSLSKRDIKDITGFELFPMVQSWNFEYNLISKIPKVNFYNSDSSFTLNFGRNVMLSDLSNLTYKATSQSGRQYFSIAEKLTTLNLMATYALTNRQLSFIAECTKLSSLILTMNKLSEYSRLLPLSDTLTDLTIGYGVLVHDNVLHLTKMILEAPHRVDNNGNIIGLTTKNITNLHPALIADYVSHAVKQYPKGQWVDLPEKFFFMNTEYRLKYKPEVLSTHEVKEENGVFKVFVNDTESTPQVVDIEAWVFYKNGEAWQRSYTEKISLSVDTTALVVTDKYEILDGLVQTTAGGAFDTKLSSIIPDEYLRYYFFKHVDGITGTKDKQLSYEELVSVETILLDNNNSLFHNIFTFKGIGLLKNLKNLEIWHAIAVDYTDLKELTTLESLVIRNGKVMMSDAIFLKSMTNLKSLSILSMDYFELNALYDLKNLEKLTLKFEQDNTTFANVLYLKNAVAYAELDGKLYEIDMSITDDQKKASLMLQSIVVPESMVSGETLTLSADASYELASATVSYKSISPNVTINVNSINATYHSFRKYAYVIASIIYNNEYFERLLIIEVTIGGGL